MTEREAWDIYFGPLYDFESDVPQGEIRAFRAGRKGMAEEMKELKRQLGEAKDALEAISSGLTTDISRVEEMTKRRAWQALQELRTQTPKAKGGE